MENTTNLKKKIPLFQRLAELFFSVYLVTLYIFVDRGATLLISKVVFILFAGCTMFFLLQRKRLHIGKKMMLSYISFTWMYATTFWARNIYYASEKMGTMWLLFILFFLTYNLFYEKEDAHEYLVKNLYISGIALIGYSIYTYGFSTVIDMMSTQSYVRLGSEINQANTFGMLNAVTLMIAFYYLLYRRKFKIFHIAIVGISFLFAMSSGSRKALLMICIGVLFLVYKRYGIRQIYKIVAIGTVLVVVFMAVIQLPMFDFITHRLEQTMEVLTGEGRGDNSTKLRLSMMEEGWRLFKERIPIGYGANNFAVISGFRTYAHNNFVEILVDFGLIGFVLYYSIYAMSLKTLWELKNDVSKALLGILLVRMMMEMAMVTYYDKINWVILAFSLISPVKDFSEDNNEEDFEPFYDEEEEICEEEIYEEISAKIEGDYDEDEEYFEKTQESYNESEPYIDCLIEQ